MIKTNNFDFLRLLFAILVIVTHSHPLSGDKGWDLLGEISNGNLQFSYIAVKGFFIISGYLIFQSLLRSKNWIDYFWKRVLRLFPGLFVVLCLTILLAPFVYESPIFYLENRKVYTYLIRNITLFKLQYSIPGVFDSNVYGSAINGSLWTICYEFSMYVLLSFLIFFRVKRMFLGLLLLFVYGLFFIFYFFLSTDFYFHIYDLNSTYLTELGLFFFGGSLLGFYNYHSFKFINRIVFFSGILIFVSELFFQNLVVSKVLLWPFFIIGIGEKATPFISQVGTRFGDLSYGIYIYGFPIQQTLMYFFDFNVIELMVLSVPISMFLGYLSWHIVEKKVLRYKEADPLCLIKLFVDKSLKYKRNVI